MLDEESLINTMTINRRLQTNMIIAVLRKLKIAKAKEISKIKNKREAISFFLVVWAFLENAKKNNFGQLTQNKLLSRFILYFSGFEGWARFSVEFQLVNYSQIQKSRESI